VADEHVPTRDVVYLEPVSDPLIAFFWARLDEERADLDPYLRDPCEGASDDERHQRRAHPAYEYATTEGQRKAWPGVDEPPEGDGWELNTTSASPDAFERFDFTEERYWRRVRPTGSREWSPSPSSTRRAAEIAAKKAVLDDYARYCADVDNPARQVICQVTRDVIKHLATVHAGHPDYREDFRP